MSKLVMTLVSTFGSMAVSYFYSAEADGELGGGDNDDATQGFHCENLDGRAAAVDIVG